ncbi:M16 family metallopeptidase [Pseudanabaena sp. Chao 1811]|uniref:M16 family metallopeptidase n=1 Tax=Pseudanabaena sp. Chao 1811 TaxID=2963092 RepID=UPI0022F40612|nr:pitrilysin family protein [Pseudanabaena sp. Chao 1811]
MPITCDRIAAKVSPQATFLKLGNGITLVHQEMSASAVVSVDVWVKAGATSDPASSLGMAHFLEHMIFKGTEAIAAGEFDLVIESEGGTSNAATSLDYAHYNFTVAASRFAIALPYLSQMLLEAKIDEQELEQERLVVLEELRQAMDDPDWIAYQHLMETAYGDHVYSRSVLGTEAVVSGITATQMREYHQTYYRPENMTVAIAGAVTREEAIKIVDAAFTRNTFSRNIPKNILSNISNGANPVQNLPTPTMRRDTISLPMVQHSRLNMAWMGTSVANLEDAIQLELVTMILTEGRSARLVRELLEESDLVQDIAGSFALQQEAALFTISAYLDAENLELVEHKIIQQVKDLQNHPIAEAELNKAKRSLCNQFIFALESPSQLANFLGYHSLLGCEELCTDWSNAYCKIIRKVKPSDLQNLVKKYLSLENYIVTCAVPA